MIETGMIQRQSQVVERLMALEEAGVELHKTIGLLEAGLECVLRGPLPTPGEESGEKAPALVGLAQQLDGQTAQIRYAARRLSDICQRLEL